MHRIAQSSQGFVYLVSVTGGSLLPLRVTLCSRGLLRTARGLTTLHTPLHQHLQHLPVPFALA